MKFNILLVAMLAIGLTACNNHDHENENGDGHGHEHEENGNHADEGHGHEKIQYTEYTSSFELFAEADVFIVGEQANILSHFTKLPSFKPLEMGAVTATLTINGKEVNQTLNKPTRVGIYSFNITPETAGTGTLRFQIDTAVISVNGVRAYAGHHEAHEHVAHEEPSMVNKVVFTKEQSWKIDFKTEKLKQEPFGQVIKTVAKISPSVGSEKVIAAKSSGMVVFPNNNLLVGKSVTSGQTLFRVSPGGISEGNISVKITEAENNFKNAEADYKRKKELANDKIISEKELLESKKRYDNAKAIYENLINNFSVGGQSIKSPINGFIKQIFVANGQFVKTGQALITLSQNKVLILNAFVQQKYYSILSTIQSATIKTLFDNRSYTFEELNGKIISYGKSVSEDNFLVPVNLQVDNKVGLVQGSLVEVYLKTLTDEEAVTVPNTSLIEEQGSYFVFVQVTPELFEKRQIKTGVTDGIRTEVISGISHGERVITIGATLVKLAKATGALDPHSGHVH